MQVIQTLDGNRTLTEAEIRYLSKHVGTLTAKRVELSSVALCVLILEGYRAGDLPGKGYTLTRTEIDGVGNATV